MHGPRSGTALRQLHDLGREQDPTGWVWAIGHLDGRGRVALPVEARAALVITTGQPATVAGVCNRLALVARRDGCGGKGLTVDGRARLLVPAWLRLHGSTTLLIGTQTDAEVVVIASTATLDSLGGLLTGDLR